MFVFKLTLISSVIHLLIKNHETFICNKSSTHINPLLTPASSLNPKNQGYFIKLNLKNQSQFRKRQEGKERKEEGTHEDVLPRCHRQVKDRTFAQNFVVPFAT